MRTLILTQTIEGFPDLDQMGLVTDAWTWGALVADGMPVKELLRTGRAAWSPNEGERLEAILCFSGVKVVEGLKGEC